MKNNISTKIALSLFLISFISVIVIQVFPLGNVRGIFSNEIDSRRAEVLKAAESFVSKNLDTPLKYTRLHANLSFNPVVNRSSFSLASYLYLSGGG